MARLVTTPASCPLVLAMNYGAILEAWAGSGGARARLPTFPAYGALFGVIVPAGTTEVTIAPAAWPPPWTLWTAAAGLLVAGLVLRGGSTSGE